MRLRIERATPWLGSGAVLLPFAAAARMSRSVLHLQGSSLRIVQSILILAGVSTAAMMFWYLYARMKRKQAKAAPPDEIDTLVARAEKRLAAHGVAEESKLSKLPVVVVLGSSGSTKTTVVVRSGLEPDLLAGEVYRGETVVPTKDVNLWYSQGRIFAEVGGKILTDPNRWATLLKKIHPGSLATVFARGRQAPRVALVCVSCEEFLKPGASDSVPALARTLRERLAELSERLGIRLPVYVLFTKTDRLPYFSEYVRNLTGEETREVWGATLPIEPAEGDGPYAEHQTRRLGSRLNGILRVLGARRLNLLPREADESAKYAAYEFPRECSKLSDLMVGFLVDLCRPTQLGLSPFLRGYYFTGVRAVVVSDPAAGAPQRQPDFRQAGTAGATMVFDPSSLKGAPQAAPSGPSRRVPQWLFLERVFREVILPDGVATGLAGGGKRVHLARRLGLGLATAAMLFVTAWMAITYAVNSQALANARDAVRQAAFRPPFGMLPSSDELRKVDRLRAEADDAGHDARGSARRWVQLGLNRDRDRHQALRRAYFYGPFQRELWEPAQRGIVDSLVVYNTRPDSLRDYQDNYDALRTHLVMTEYADRATGDMIDDVLTAYWPGEQLPTTEQDSLARLQFAFYGDELPYGNPYPGPFDSTRVRSTQEYLARALQPAPFYENLLKEMPDSIGQIAFQSDLVRSGHVFSGAYSDAGWTLLKGRISDLASVLAADDWVLGRRIADQDIRFLSRAIDSLYVARYEQNWLRFLDEASVTGMGSRGDAARALAALGGNESPMMRLLALVSVNTMVDDSIAASFQPVHTVMPPDQTESYLNDSNGPYATALRDLAVAMEDVAGCQRDACRDAQAAADAAADASQAALDALASSFHTRGRGAGTSRATTRFLQSPIARAESLTRGVAEGQVGRAVAGVCREVAPILGRYPFSAGSSQAVDVAAFGALLQPETGTLWGHEAELVELANVMGEPLPAPTRNFFAQAHALSSALFSGAGSSPTFRFLFAPDLSDVITQVDLRVDNESRTWTRSDPSSKIVTWIGANARNVRLDAVVNGTRITLFSDEGPWAVFRFLEQGSWTPQPQPGQNAVRWSFAQSAVDLTGDVRLNESAIVLQGGRFPPLRCGS